MASGSCDEQAHVVCIERAYEAESGLARLNLTESDLARLCFND